MSSLRKIKPMATPGVEPSKVQGQSPVFEWIDPSTLLVDDAYQRNLSERSVTLIRTIVGSFSWASFKPPVCARTLKGLEVIDGQHTAIAAASHPDISTIPVSIVDAEALAARAGAFLAHNRNRVAMTPTQMHHAAVAAGDEDAATIAQVAARAKVTILRSQPAIFGPRETVAVAAIGTLIRRRGPIKARQVLETVADSGMAPVSMAAIKAVDYVLFEESAGATLKLADVTSAIRALGPAADREGRVFAATHNLPVWRGVAAIYLKKVARARR